MNIWRRAGLRSGDCAVISSCRIKFAAQTEKQFCGQQHERTKVTCRNTYRTQHNPISFRDIPHREGESGNNPQYGSASTKEHTHSTPSTSPEFTRSPTHRPTPCTHTDTKKHTSPPDQSNIPETDSADLAPKAQHKLHSAQLAAQSTHGTVPPQRRPLFPTDKQTTS